MNMTCTLLCSAGVCLEYGGKMLLIDVLNGAWRRRCLFEQFLLPGVDR